VGLMSRAASAAVVALLCLCASPVAQATFPGENGKIAFVRDGDIWIMDPDGSNQEQITSSAAIDRSPKWSADGSAIAFWRQKDEHNRVLIYDVASGVISRLEVPENAGNPTWSPDGKKLVIRRWALDEGPEGPFPRLTIVSRQGTVLVPDISAFAGGFNADWSPLGDQIAYAYAFDGMASIFSVDPQGIDSLALSPAAREPGDFTHDPSWAPDASLVAFGHAQEKYCEPTGPNSEICAYLTQIYVVKPDGSGLTQLTAFDSGHADDNPTWSPDGTKIVYQRSGSPFSAESDPTLRGMDADGGNDVDLGVGGVVGAPDWQPLVPPRNSNRPTLSGIPRSGEELDASPGRWTGTPEITFSYRWQRCSRDFACEDIPSANGPSYQLTADEVNHSIRVFVTAANAQGESTAWSVATELVGVTLVGTDADDHLDGTLGGDLLRGLGGDDRLGGSYGDDTLLGGGGDDRLQGDFGADQLVGGPGADRILGGNSPQYSSVGDGRDEVRGGDGPDWIHFRDGRRDVVDCGRGRDVVFADARDDLHGDCEVAKIG
jgi:hypothetical protein